MLPITKLPNVSLLTPSSYLVVTNRTKQPPPYDIPTNFNKKLVSNFVKTGSLSYVTADQHFNVESLKDVSSKSQFAYNKAYERFVNELGDSSSFGATLTAERRETFGMITGFAAKAFLATRQASKGNFRGLLKTLGMSPPTKVITRYYPRNRRRKAVKLRQIYYKMPDGRLVLKGAASSWLLWSYGISPLMGDIQNATEVFIRELPRGVPIMGSAKEEINFFTGGKVLGGTYSRHDYKGTVKAKITARVEVTNYDLWLLNQLGAVNPVQWLNEAVPFSFVVDWASNWSSVINSLTDFIGLNILLPSVSSVIKVHHKYESFNVPPWPTNYGSYERDFLAFSRRTSIPMPVLKFRYERFEWQRGLNAISLLVGFLPAKRK
jgi:hypothetical protein